MIAELVRRYSILGIQCTNLEVQKLAWFLQRTINGLHLDNPLRLTFQANKYGPYADNLRHLLNGLDGSYLHCENVWPTPGRWNRFGLKIPSLLAFGITCLARPRANTASIGTDSRCDRRIRILRSEWNF